MSLPDGHTFNALRPPDRRSLLLACTPVFCLILQLAARMDIV